jgi:uncharacterized protein YjaG (DUF416 family)
VYSILEGITKFAKVCFNGEVANQSFYRKTTKEIFAVIVNNDAVINFDKLTIKKKDWENVKNTEVT